MQRLQVLLSAASVASQTGGDGKGKQRVLLRSACRPALNLFPCAELVSSEGEWWLYAVDVERMRERLALPVGSCELSLSVNYPGNAPLDDTMDQ